MRFSIMINDSLFGLFLNYVCLNKMWYVLYALFMTVINGAEIEIVNTEIGPIWVGIQGIDGHQHLSNGGFELGAGQRKILTTVPDWRGNIWARTYCDPKSSNCLTGDCGNRIECRGNFGTPPFTLVQLFLNYLNEQDYYRISFEYGFNIAATIEAYNRSNCTPISCRQHLNDDCPDKLKILFPKGWSIACKSVCHAFNTDRDCCRGRYDNESKCDPYNWSINSAEYFENRCPLVAVHKYDTHKTQTCDAYRYTITFGRG